MVTLKQIAEEAGVSIQTVANVLQGRTQARWPSISQRANRVRAIAERLNYRPNAAAKSMRTRRSWQIGVLIANNPADRFRNIAAYETILGINEGLENDGYILSLVRIGDVRNPLREQSRAFRERMFDGMIVVSTVPDDVVKQVSELSAKCVWVDVGVWQETACLRRDERLAGRLATKALADLGYQRVLWVGRPTDATAPDMHYSVRDRLTGVEQGARHRGLRLEKLLEELPILERRPQAIAPWLTPDVGIITYSSAYARWLAHTAASLGLRPGYDFGLVCCDDSHNTSAHWPGLSRVSFDRFDLGLQAATMIIDLLKDKPCPSRTVRGCWRPGNTAWGPKPFSPQPIP